MGSGPRGEPPDKKVMREEVEEKVAKIRQVARDSTNDQIVEALLKGRARKGPGRRGLRSWIARHGKVNKDGSGELQVLLQMSRIARLHVKAATSTRSGRFEKQVAKDNLWKLGKSSTWESSLRYARERETEAGVRRGLRRKTLSQIAPAEEELDTQPDDIEEEDNGGQTLPPVAPAGKELDTQPDDTDVEDNGGQTLSPIAPAEEEMDTQPDDIEVEGNGSQEQDSSGANATDWSPSAPWSQVWQWREGPGHGSIFSGVPPAPFMHHASMEEVRRGMNHRLLVLVPSIDRDKGYATITTYSNAYLDRGYGGSTAFVAIDKAITFQQGEMGALVVLGRRSDAVWTLADTMEAKMRKYGIRWSIFTLEDTTPLRMSPDPGAAQNMVSDSIATCVIRRVDHRVVLAPIISNDSLMDYSRYRWALWDLAQKCKRGSARIRQWDYLQASYPNNFAADVNMNGSFGGDAEYVEQIKKFFGET
jgi:hypothetical protein